MNGSVKNQVIKFRFQTILKGHSSFRRHRHRGPGRQARDAAKRDAWRTRRQEALPTPQAPSPPSPPAPPPPPPAAPPRR